MTVAAEAAVESGRAGSRAPLGRDFGRLWTAAAFSNLADGIGRTAVPLIATTLTRDPLAISAIAAIAFLPWLLFGLPAGMLVDRFERRRIMAIANGVRGAVALWLAILTVTGGISLWALLVGTLLFAIGETLFDNATNAALPGVVTRPQLDRANGWMQAAQVTIVCSAACSGSSARSPGGCSRSRPSWAAGSPGPISGSRSTSPVA